MLIELEKSLAQIEGGQEVLDARRQELSRPPETRAGRDIRERARLMYLEQRGIIKLGTGKIPESFWRLPRPDDPEGSIRWALAEDREDRL